MSIKMMEDEINYMMNSKFMVGSSLQYKFANIANNLNGYWDLVNLYEIVKREFDKRCEFVESNLYQRTLA